jgi:S-formylglutathione hydrolase FrmB
MVILVGLPVQHASAIGWRKDSAELALANATMKGKIVDHTANHGHDNRMYSRLLGQRRDLYVYLPPNYDPAQRYPIAYFLHGFGQDEKVFLQIAPLFDKAIASCQLPPLIVVCPDGTLGGEAHHAKFGSYFLNTSFGDYEDYILQDVWDFICRHYSIRSERGAHILTGYSMGGFAAFNLGLRHRQAFGVVVGIVPLLNLRWEDDLGNPYADFDPRHWGWRQCANERHHHGLPRHGAPIPLDPLLGNTDEVIFEISKENPIEMIDRCCLRNGELSMYIGYGGRDEFNVDAQVESFLYVAKFRRIGVAVGYAPNGRHNLQTLYTLWPGIMSWLAQQLAPYSPPHVISDHAVPAATPHSAPASPPFQPPACPGGACPPPVQTQTPVTWDNFVGPLRATAPSRPATP